MNSYAGLTTLKNRLGITGTGDDTQLRLLLEAASRVVDKFCGREFFAESATRHFDGDSSPLLVDDLLSITTFQLDEDGDGTFESTLAGTDYILYPLNKLPAELIRVSLGGNYGSFASGVIKGVKIVGLWGYGDGESASPYTNSGTTTNEELDVSETGVDVVNGAALEAGQTILIESEQMYIQSIATNTLTVQRGVNGTAAATHATSKIVYIYSYPETIREAVILTASRLWKRKDSAYAAVIATPELGQIEVYRGLDADVKMFLQPFIKAVKARWIA